MEQKYIIGDYTIGAVIDDTSVHIINSEDLRQLFSKEIALRTDQLTARLLKDFEQRNGRAFTVTADSLAVELWGHVYFEHFVLVIKRLLQLRFIDNIAEQMIQYSEVIDCGEEGTDSNRWLWDVLAPFKNMIAGWLPGITSAE
jgi:hypothetical protein